VAVDGSGDQPGRILSTVLFGLATLQLIGTCGPALAAAALTWLSGPAAVWLLWRPGLRRVLQVMPAGGIDAAAVSWIIDGAGAGPERHARCRLHLLYPHRATAARLASVR